VVTNHLKPKVFFQNINSDIRRGILVKTFKNLLSKL